MDLPSTGGLKPLEARFVTTHWSVVLAAGGNEDTTRSTTALARLCQTYWYPLYAYVRRRGYSAHDAQDLTQEFFAHLLERQAFTKADPARGRFRSFLLTALNHFLINEWEKARAQKRSSGQLISLDLASAEGRFDLEPVDRSSPDSIFAKTWAVALLEEVLNQLEAEYGQAGKAELFAVLKQTLTGARETQPYAYLAEQLGMNEGAIKTAVHRLRKRYRELLHIEVTNTLANPEDAAQEMRDLFAALAG
jgi:RNA polymerase sigma factor (sigma-70 family)